MPRKLKEQTFIVLSIHEIHAERIFTKQKLYELRKVLPKDPFQKVFLYQTGGKGLVGAFDVDKVLKDNIVDLWETVGEDATSEDRFFAYFGERQEGCAIKVKNPRRFRESVSKEVLSKELHKFTAPQSFLIIRPDTKNHEILSGIYQKELKKKSPSTKSGQRAMTILEI